MKKKSLVVKIDKYHILRIIFCVIGFLCYQFAGES